MASEGLRHTIGPAVVLLAAGVLVVPLFRRIGLGSVLGYFAAGAIIGPSILGWASQPDEILHFAELGVVMFLFLIGLELRPQKLWSMRGQIFGLGMAQVMLCIVLLTVTAAWLFGIGWIASFVAASGFVMSSTAVIMSMLQERGEVAEPEGQKAVSILLFEDLMIVPLLAAIGFLSPAPHTAQGLQGVLIALGAIATLIAGGHYLLNPFFALLARAGAREVLTAGALLVVLGAALLMEAAGLSMAMGAFLAGVMLSGSSYRHQIESDVEPFRGLLMGLFFLAVGMSLDLRMVLEQLPLLVSMLTAAVAVKAVGIYTVARLSRSTHHAALHRATLFAQGGEFAFVIYLAARQGDVITQPDNAVFSTVIILSMALTPLLLLASDSFLKTAPSLHGVERARALKGQVLLIGFGRFGQIAAQVLLSKGVDVAIIDHDPDRIREAERFGFKIFYGDGSRLDILEHSGARESRVILVCIDDRKSANHIVEIAHAHFPNARLVVCSYDRAHSIELIRKRVDVEIRETVESALRMGGEGLLALGCDATSVEDAVLDVRRRDAERLAAQVQGDIYSGKDKLHSPVPEPLVQPAHPRKQGDATPPAV